MNKSTTSLLAVSLGLCAGAHAGVVLNGGISGTLPSNGLDTAAVYTNTQQLATDAVERDVRPANPARNLTQTFQVATPFQLDAIYLEYQAPGGTGYVNGTFVLRIFAVADVNAAGNPAPAAVGADLLNISITLDAAARTAASFTTSSSVTSVLKFDLTDADEILLAATIGTAGYGLQFNTDASTVTTGGGFFTWRKNDTNPYAAGRFFDATTAQAGSDATLALTAVPEPSSILLLLGSASVLGLRRRRG